MKKTLLMLAIIAMFVGSCAYKTAQVDPMSLKEDTEDEAAVKELNSVDAKRLGKKAGQLLKLLGEKGGDFLAGFDEETSAMGNISDRAKQAKEKFSKVVEKFKNK